MMSHSHENEPRRRDQLRRVLSRFTTTFRRGSAIGDINNSDLSSSASPAVGAQDEATSHLPLLLDASNVIVADDHNVVGHIPSIASSIRSVHRSRRNSTLSIGSCTTIDRTVAHNERAQRMLKRYGVDISPYNRQSFSHLPPTVSRVAKAPRMRINRSCHQCGLDVGTITQCIACEHRICKHCPRVAGRKVRTVLQETRESQAQGRTENERMSIDPVQPIANLSETQSLSSVNTTMVLEVDEDEHEQIHEEYPLPSSERDVYSTTDIERLMSRPLMSLEADDDDTSLMPLPPLPSRAMRSAASTQIEYLEATSSRPCTRSILA